MFDIPDEAYRNCTLKAHWPPEIGFTTIALVYGTNPLHFAWQERPALIVSQTL